MEATMLTLIEGESYGFNFAGAPGGHGIFRGFVQPIGYIALEDDEGNVTFYNPSLLCTLRPETYPV